MSADNGYVIQYDHRADQYTLQMYFMSNESYPNPSSARINERFLTKENAVSAYEEMNQKDWYLCEYGLTFNLPEYIKKENKSVSTVKLRNYTRRPFNVDAIQVTEENMSEVTALCRGILHHVGPAEKYFIQVPVKKPASPRHAQAYVGDYVVYYQKGWKVYQERAFKSTFQDTVGVANDLTSFAQRENG